MCLLHQLEKKCTEQKNASKNCKSKIGKANNKQKDPRKIVNEFWWKYSETPTNNNLNPNTFHSFYSQKALD